MKKIIKLENLDCAHCAAKMEKGISGIEGVTSATVSFMAQKIVLEADGDMDEIVKQVVKIVKKVEPDCEVLL